MGSRNYYDPDNAPGGPGWPKRSAIDRRTREHRSENYPTGKRDPNDPYRVREALEKNIETRCLGWLATQPRWKQIKPNIAMHLRGEPDRIGCLAGRFVAIEFKRPGEKQTPLQAAKMDEWRRAGAVCMVATSLDDVIRALVAAGYDVIKQKWEVWPGE